MSQPSRPGANGLFAVAVVLALAAGPSHGAAQGTATGPAPSPCQLLDHADAETIVGKRLQAPGPLEGGPASCAYTPLGETVSLLTISYEKDYATSAEFYQALEASARNLGVTVKRMSDVGEGALIIPEFGMMWVYARTRSAAILADSDAIALGAARKLVQRLGAP
jgi:hypothetical protein